MDPQTLLTLGVVVLAATALFVTARAGAVAIGVLPPAPGIGDPDDEGGDTDAASPTETDTDAASPAQTGGSVSAPRDDADGRRRKGQGRGPSITPADHERIRNHLKKDPLHRSPDDLLPTDDDS